MIRRVGCSAALAVVLAAGTLAGWLATRAEGPPDPAAVQAAASTSRYCRANPMANVHNASLLRVVKPCITVAGTVRLHVPAPDGDVHIELALDRPYSGLADGHNLGGWLVLEIVPADQPGCVPGQPIRPRAPRFGRCTGADVPTPAFGQYIRATGPYIVDTAYGWMELHPVWHWAVAPS
ncbi:MAG: hypothetical protein ACYDAG_11870 [Chloroflexota bacterium]